MIDIEAEVCRIWKDTLPDATGHHDEDFFNAGGSSLSAAIFVAGLRDVGIDVPLTAIFEDGRLATIIEQAKVDLP